MSNNQDTLQRWVDSFLQTLESVGAQLNESRTDLMQQLPLQSHVFLGIQFVRQGDFVSINLAEKTVKKLTRLLEFFNKKSPPTWHIHEWQAVFGLLIFASAVKEIRRHQYYWCYKFMRRKVSQYADGAISEKVKGWKCIQETWLKWVNECLKDPELKFSPSDRNLIQRQKMTLYTDASNTGFGAVLFGGEVEQIVAGKWWTEKTISSHINVKELLAVRLALERLDFGDCSLILFVDNTTVIGQLAAQRANNFLVNAEIGKILDTCDHKGIQIQEIRFVKSEENVADYWSRLWSSNRV